MIPAGFEIKLKMGAEFFVEDEMDFIMQKGGVVAVEQIGQIHAVNISDAEKNGSFGRRIANMAVNVGFEKDIRRQID